jgi:hypothetical protein
MQIGGVGIYGRDAAANELYLTSNAYNSSTGWKYIYSAAATRYDQDTGSHKWFQSTDPTPTAGNAISFTQAMTLDASGNLGIGDTSPAERLVVSNTYRDVTSSQFTQIIRSTSSQSIGRGGSLGFDGVITGTTTTSFAGLLGGKENSTDNNTAGYLAFLTRAAGAAILEKARITSGGDFCVKKTSGGQVADIGAELAQTGYGMFTVDANPCLYINRKTDDGDLVRFYQDTVQEGSITVSGNTVSYNAFAGSHWSQLQDGSKPDILRGTVMESINELCVWPGENNERLPKSKISDVAGSKKVYGVFMAWDNDWSETNDMYVTAVGAFICRVNGSVTVQEGDLLESNGDGTARVQADDIIRSSTIGKVTSTVKTHQYADGSYCVPTVLYCG